MILSFVVFATLLTGFTGATRGNEYIVSNERVEKYLCISAMPDSQEQLPPIIFFGRRWSDDSSPQHQAPLPTALSNAGLLASHWEIPCPLTIEDMFCSGCLYAVEDSATLDAVKEDPGVSTRTLATRLGCSQPKAALLAKTTFLKSDDISRAVADFFDSQPP
ncbi:hypothetical protein RB195_013135 [Necator americanus]|uniref:Uncharacterized protein n=1 Tax=Necator americanus TaxID=51031 RepID=A0ABR1DVC4_NECAM